MDSRGACPHWRYLRLWDLAAKNAEDAKVVGKDLRIIRLQYLSKYSYFISKFSH